MGFLQVGEAMKTSDIHEMEVFGGFAYTGFLPSAYDADSLVRMHMRLVQRIARSIFVRMSAAVPMEDLVQIGLVALIEAARVFEPRGVAKFSTYASCRVRGAIIDELRHHATISRQALRDRRSFAQTSERLARQLDRRPSDGDMAQALGMDLAVYRKAAAATSSLRFQSIDAIPSDSNSAFADPAPNAFSSLEHDQMKRAVDAAIDELPGVEGKVMQLYFVEEMSLDDIGEMLGVTGTRICHIKKKAVDKLRRKLTGWA